MKTLQSQTNPWNELKTSRATRLELCRQSHQWFFAIYVPHYLTYATAPLHNDLFRITEDDNTKLAVIVAFRGSGKSTMMTLSYPIWSIIGKQHRKFVLILSQTQAQARQHMMNLRQELESNDLLRGDFGAFEEDTDQWGLQSLVIPRYGARITVASSEQSTRGLRNRQFRPDLIICDDVEDLSSVKTKESRDRTYAWLTGEIMPAGDHNTKIIVIGNLLHEDSLLMRLKARIVHGDLNGIFKSYPIINTEETIAWPGKFPNLASIETLRKTIASDASWQREFMLKIVVDQEQVVHPEWIHYYDELPKDSEDNFRYTGIGVDLAISLKETADYTGMVIGKVFGSMDDMRIYILPNPINEHLTFPRQREKIIELAKTLRDTRLFIEVVNYESSLIQELERRGYLAESVRTHQGDKRSRLALVTHLIANGQVLFPRHGAELLIQQLTGFGTENHDDLADAFAVLMRKVLEHDEQPIEYFFA